MKRIIFTLATCFSLSISHAQDNKPLSKKDYEKIIDDFAVATTEDTRFGNGLSARIDKPKNDKDALTKGLNISHYDNKQNSGWKILAAKYIVIGTTFAEKYRAVLYNHKAYQYIALYKPEKDGKYYFRIYSSVYGK